MCDDFITLGKLINCRSSRDVFFLNIPLCFPSQDQASDITNVNELIL